MRDDDHKTTLTVIPAQPGWFLSMVIKGHGDDPARLSDRPIMAWEIVRTEGSHDPVAGRRGRERWVHREVIPITFDDAENYSNDMMIKDPAGKYHDLNAGPFDTAEQVIEHFADCYRQTAELKELQAAKLKEVKS